MSDGAKGLEVRLAAAERERDSWRETAVYERHNAQAAQNRLTDVMFERNLLERERRALWTAIRNLADNDGDIGQVMDLLASMAQPLREGEGLLAKDEAGD